MWMYIPQDLSWKLKMMISKRYLLFQRFHVQLPSLNCRGLPCLADLGDGIPIPSLNHWTAVKQLWPPGRNGETSWSDDRNPVSIMIEQPHSKPTNIASNHWRLLISSEYQFPTKKSAQLRINNYSYTLPYLTLHYVTVWYLPPFYHMTYSRFNPGHKSFRSKRSVEDIKSSTEMRCCDLETTNEPVVRWTNKTPHPGIVANTGL